jgi:hypothetical protein
VDAGDAALNRGAPNVDGVAPRVALNWFHRVRTACPMPEVIRPQEA